MMIRRHWRALRQVAVTACRSPPTITKSAWVRARSVAPATADQLRLAQRQGAQDDPVQAGLQPALDAGGVLLDLERLAVDDVLVAGHTVAIITSATRYQAEPVARELGIDRVALLGGPDEVEADYPRLLEAIKDSDGTGFTVFDVNMDLIPTEDR